MNEPWFPEHYAWVFGTGIGVLAGIIGTMVGILAPMGKAKAIVFAIYWFGLIASAVCLIAGISAVLAGQPYGVWYGLLLAGFIGSLVLGANYFTMVYAYRRAEARKMAAQNL